MKDLYCDNLLQGCWFLQDFQNSYRKSVKKLSNGNEIFKCGNTESFQLILSPAGANKTFIVTKNISKFMKLAHFSCFFLEKSQQKIIVPEPDFNMWQSGVFF